MARRKPKSSHDLGRKEPSRITRERVLIVCEGEKTEPRYFNELIKHYRLNTADIHVIPADGTDPSSIVRSAKEKVKDEKKNGGKYDEVYCVFDRDQHHHFDASSKTIKDKGFKNARSWPCFEYWLLLHFTYQRAPFQGSQKKTAAEECKAKFDVESKKQFPDYAEGKGNISEILIPHIDQAKKNAVLALSDAEETKEKNPSTEVHLLVEYLQRLKDN